MRFTFLDRLAERQGAAIGLGSRILLAAIFVPSGFHKLAHFGDFESSIAGKGLPLPVIWSLAAVAVELLGGLCVLLGALTRPAALAMFAFTGFAAVLGHAFWAAPPSSYMAQYVNFMKNIAIMGGFLALFLAGPGRLSLDQHLSGLR